MSWLVPSVIATLTGTAILSIVFFYIYLQDSKKYLKIWSISWAIYFTRYVFLLLFLTWQKNPIFLIGNQLSGLISGILLLFGSYLFINKKFPLILWYLSSINAIWIFVSIIKNFPFMLMSLPTFSFLALIYIWTGFVFARHSKSEQKEASIVGASFIIWGIHKANYPFFKPVVWLAPWGYLIAAVLEFVTALGLLLVYFRKAKNEVLESQHRLVDAQKIAKIGDWSWEMETNELIWSNETYRIFGHVPGTFQVTVKAFEEAIHPDDYDQFILEREAALKENRDVDIEHRIVLPDKRIRWVHELSSTHTDDDGNVIKISGTVQDITERKFYEQELTKSKEKFIQYFDTNPSATFVWQADKDDFILVEVNAAANKMTENRAQEFIGLTASDIYKDLPEMMDRFRACQSEKSIIEFELHYKNRYKGEYDWIHFRCAFSEPDKILLYADTITEKKNAEKALIDSEQRWRNILINTPQIGIALNRKAEIIFANEHFLNLTGWRKDDVIGQNWFDMFIPEPHREKIKKVFEASMNQKDEISFSNFENVILTKSGRILEVAWSNVLSRDSNGNIIDVTCLGLDLTERKLAEQAINQQKRLFETMFNTIPDGVIITNTDREIILANKGMEKTFGYKPDELIGKKTRFLYATEDHFRQTGKNVFGKEVQKSGELYITGYKDKIGREFFGETFGAKLFNEANQWIGNLGIIRDITDRLETENRLQQAQKMESVGSLAGGIAHDFNNILFPIIGMSELMLEDLPPDSMEYENAREIYKAGNRAKDLVSQILAFSRQSELEMMPVRLQKVLKEVLKLCRASIPTNIEIEQNIQQDCGSVWANATQLHQVGMNLVTNAYHAVQNQNGKITIELKEVIIERDNKAASTVSPGKYALLSIKDNGIGMSGQIKSKIFDPYFTTKEKGKGTGLGLSVVYGIVKEFGGDIHVHSQVDLGTIFDVYLPLMETDTDEESSRLRTEDPTGDEHILLADDEPSVARLVQLMLERLGYTVTVRVSSTEALETFKRHPENFDLVISDMSMPHMTGDQLSKEILSIKPDTPIIICTGFSERINKEQAEGLGVKGFLMKPVVKSDMAQMIRTVLDESKQKNSGSLSSIKNQCF